MSRRIRRDRTAPDSLKFVQNLVLNVSREGTKDSIWCTLRVGRRGTNYLSREAPESEKIVYSKERQIIYCILDVYICYLRKLLRARSAQVEKCMETDESYNKNETK